MLSCCQTFDDTRTIKVLVVPIGNNSLFDEHFQVSIRFPLVPYANDDFRQVVSKLREIPFYELNRPTSNGAKSNILPSVLKHFDWNHGNLRYEYLRYDRFLLGPGDLDNFQVLLIHHELIASYKCGS